MNILTLPVRLSCTSASSSPVRLSCTSASSSLHSLVSHSPVTIPIVCSDFRFRASFVPTSVSGLRLSSSRILGTFDILFAFATGPDEVAGGHGDGDGLDGSTAVDPTDQTPLTAVSDSTDMPGAADERVSVDEGDFKNRMNSIEQRILALVESKNSSIEERLLALESRRDIVESKIVLVSPKESKDAMMKRLVEYRKKLELINSGEGKVKDRILKDLADKDIPDDFRSELSTSLIERSQLVNGLLDLALQLEEFVAGATVQVVEPTPGSPAADPTAVAAADLIVCNSFPEVLEQIRNVFKKHDFIDALFMLAPTFIEFGVSLLPPDFAALFSKIPEIYNETVSSFFDALKSGEPDARRIFQYRVTALVGHVFVAVAISVLSGGRLNGVLKYAFMVLFGANVSAGGYVSLRNAPRS